MTKSLDNENIAVTYPFKLTKQENQRIDEFLKKSKYPNPSSKAYELLVILYDEINQKYQLSTIENKKLKDQLVETNKLLDLRPTIQCTDDVSIDKSNNLSVKEKNLDESVYKRSLSDEIGVRPTRLERDIKLLYEQCMKATPKTDLSVLVTNVVSLGAHLLRMEKRGIILEDVVKQLENNIMSLQKEITEKNLLIEQLKLCEPGLETNFKSTKSDNSNNLEISNCEANDIHLLKHNLLTEKIKCEELSKEVTFLQQHLHNMKLSLYSKEKELSQLKQNKDDSLTVILEQQNEMFKEDFKQERLDRENAQSKVIELEKEKNFLLKNMQVIKQLLEKCSAENQIMREELGKVNSLQSIISDLRQENMALKDELKLSHLTKLAPSQIQINQNAEKWPCPTCTFLNESSQRICQACMKSRFPMNLSKQ